MINEDFAISKTFLILYRNEEIILDDCILFKISAIINVLNVSFGQPLGIIKKQCIHIFCHYPTKMVETFERLDLQLSIDLWFSENDYSVERVAQMQLLCARQLKVRFDPRIGIHLQIPILFDYFHLSAVLATIHASLLTLLPPMVSFGYYQVVFFS